jgi:hypothetical protein
MFRTYTRCGRMTVCTVFAALLSLSAPGCAVVVTKSHQSETPACTRCGDAHHGPCHGQLDPTCHGLETTRWRLLDEYCGEACVELSTALEHKELQAPEAPMTPMDETMPMEQVPGEPVPGEPGLNEPMPMPQFQPDVTPQTPPANDNGQAIRSARLLFASVRQGLQQSGHGTMGRSPVLSRRPSDSQFTLAKPVAPRTPMSPLGEGGLDSGFTLAKPVAPVTPMSPLGEGGLDSGFTLAKPVAPGTTVAPSREELDVAEPVRNDSLGLASYINVD